MSQEVSFIEFFQTRQSLYVSDGFRDLIVAKATPAEPVEVKIFDLQRNMPDSEIEDRLGDGHLFDEGALCATIQKMIEAQVDGKEGVLLNNQYANFFYTASCLVDVHWLADDRDEWYVSTWPRDGVGWNVGARVFYPATGA